MANSKKHPLTYFREQRENRAKMLSKHQVPPGEVDYKGNSMSDAAYRSKTYPKFYDKQGNMIEPTTTSSNQEAVKKISNNPPLADAYKKTYGPNWQAEMKNSYGVGDKRLREMAGETPSNNSTFFKDYLKANPSASAADTSEMFERRRELSRLDAVNRGIHKKGGSVKSKSKLKSKKK